MNFEEWFKKFLPCFECVCFVTEDQLRADLGAAWATAYSEGQKDGFKDGVNKLLSNTRRLEG